MLTKKAVHGIKVHGTGIGTVYSKEDGIYYYFADDPIGGLADIAPSDLKVKSRGEMRAANGEPVPWVSLTWK